MKKTITSLCLLLCVMSAYAKGIREDVSRNEEKSRLGYAFGVVIGIDLRDAGMDIDYTAFADGLQASVENGKLLFSEQEAIEMVEAAMREAMDKKTEQSRNDEQVFLEQNGSRPEVRTTASGLQYEVLAEGEGEKPGPDSTVRVHYEGSFTGGAVFDSSYEDGKIAEIPLNRVIRGWAEGIQLMSVGSKYRFYIPSGLAYGENGAGQVIPPYATLIFTVELFEIMTSDSPDSGKEAEE